MSPRRVASIQNAPVNRQTNQCAFAIGVANLSVRPNLFHLINNQQQLDILSRPPDRIFKLQ